MLKRVARWARRLAEWLDPTPPRMGVRIWVPRDALFERARALGRHQELTRPEPGFGESKRHQVYARLMKEFPERSKRAIALAIEASL